MGTIAQGETAAINIPVILYHGCARKSPTFGRERWAGVGGIYFTDNHADACEHALMDAETSEEEPVVVCARVTIRNPKLFYGTASQEIPTSTIEGLEAAGFDGAVGIAGGIPYEYVAFDPGAVEIVMVEPVPTHLRPL